MEFVINSHLLLFSCFLLCTIEIGICKVTLLYVAYMHLIHYNVLTTLQISYHNVSASDRKQLYNTRACW